MATRVASAEETIASERATIESGTPAAELMRRAGRAASEIIYSRYEKWTRNGVVVYVGPGNNGGDGWVVAELLAKKGLSVRVIELGSPRSAESIAARAAAMQSAGIRIGGSGDGELLAIDAILGTGSHGAPRGDSALAIGSIEELRASGAQVVSLDLPSGLDATTGEHQGSVRANGTVSFGLLKRGHLIARDVCGEITVVDIGLRETEAIAALPMLVDDEWTLSRVPRIASDAHKGTRKRLAIVAGGKGMAGAAILSGEGALRSGIGLLRVVCARDSEVAVHAGIPAALVQHWPETPEEIATLAANADAIAIGPGLGKSDATRDLVDRILLATGCPVVLDADALNVFESDVGSLATLITGRAAILTPHPAEMGRLIGASTDDVLAHRFEIGIHLAKATGAAVLLKGSPTIVFSALGNRYVIASGTAALATGGSGDVLTGIAGTLLAQMPDGDDRSAEAAACAAFIHGRAAELCRFVRGVTLDDILRAMPIAWNEQPRKKPEGTLANLESHS
jgi:ADP-dependent NAD(P)H-hydrate dehydratase / NAD(P)H-hydrate epimerase